ncbi:hypothetical protein H310_12508 [Aphanomyces invadans]|uniref:Uncharacterized protein n=1 Tax=Aphanomyces invadans TaxID=157072 RepID=A0A024TJG4_9STRA|nr:hypothetical protein H310_12508 [Aphanomyces invadans]ETV93457.1 hypothetical protein H310_12508 [Aphanomyces invadans]|eukprot:XP_008877799.1 hypothetical protein H310_12508 [Aphanomyces invadans]
MSSNKPQVTDANKEGRLQWAIQYVHSTSPSDYHFDDLMGVVHVDEEWFYATKINKAYSLVPGEEPPHCTCKSKRFIA